MKVMQDGLEMCPVMLTFYKARSQKMWFGGVEPTDGVLEWATEI